MESKKVLEKILYLSQSSKNYFDFLSQNSFDLENKILFYICFNENCSPQDMIDFFKIKKTNLAMICNNLIEKNLIEKQKNTIDARSITYKATALGCEKLDAVCRSFDEKNSLDEKEISSLEEKLDSIIKFLKI